jgi:hypothetical protein
MAQELGSHAAAHNNKHVFQKTRSQTGDIHWTKRIATTELCIITTHDNTTTFNNKTDYDYSNKNDMATDGHNSVPNELEPEAPRSTDLPPARAQMRPDRERNPDSNEGTTIDTYNNQTTTDQQSTNRTD